MLGTKCAPRRSLGRCGPFDSAQLPAAGALPLWHDDSMNVFERVRSFVVGRSPDAFCMSCIAEQLGLNISDNLSHVTRALATFPNFFRHKYV
jgi:hypothetical protein